MCHYAIHKCYSMKCLFKFLPNFSLLFLTLWIFFQRNYNSLKTLWQIKCISKWHDKGSCNQKSQSRSKTSFKSQWTTENFFTVSHWIIFEIVNYQKRTGYVRLFCNAVSLHFNILFLSLPLTLLSGPPQISFFSTILNLDIS